jgi:hypothetical protein
MSKATVRKKHNNPLGWPDWSPLITNGWSPDPSTAIQSLPMGLDWWKTQRTQSSWDWLHFCVSLFHFFSVFLQ